MKLFFSAMAVVILFLFTVPQSARAEGKDEACTSATCRCAQQGVCGRAHGRAECVIRVVAPTFGGEITLDLRDANKKSRFEDGARKKTVGPGRVWFGVGCTYFEQPTVEVYLCALKQEGTPGFVSTRHEEEIQKALKEAYRTGRGHLRMCLKGQECPRWVPGPPPR